jgi:hypothetical protein
MPHRTTSIRLTLQARFAATFIAAPLLPDGRHLATGAGHTPPLVEVSHWPRLRTEAFMPNAMLSRDRS